MLFIFHLLFNIATICGLRLWENFQNILTIKSQQKTETVQTCLFVLCLIKKMTDWLTDRTKWFLWIPEELCSGVEKKCRCFYLSFSFCSFSFLSFSALASSASCFLISSSTSFCFSTLILVLPFSRVSVAISTAQMDTEQRRENQICRWVCKRIMVCYTLQ